MIYILLCICLISFCSCTHLPEDRAAITQLTFELSQQLSKNEGLELYAYGTSHKNEKISGITVFYHADKAVDLKKARNILLQCAGWFLNEANKDPGVTKYMEHYPLTILDLEVIIRFSPDESNISDEAITAVLLRKGKIAFFGNRNEDLILKETYETAVKELAKN